MFGWKLRSPFYRAANTVRATQKQLAKDICGNQKRLASVAVAYENQRRHLVEEREIVSNDEFRNGFLNKLGEQHWYQEAVKRMRVDHAQVERSRVDAVLALMDEARTIPDDANHLLKVIKQACAPDHPRHYPVTYAVLRVDDIATALQSYSQDLGSHYPEPVEHIYNRYYSPADFGL